MIRSFSLLLILNGCSLAVSDIPDGGQLVVQTDAQTPTPDSGPNAPNDDAGTAQAVDVGPRAALADCVDNQRADLIGHQCVPITGTATTCRDAQTLRRDHSWARDAAVVRYAAPQGTGDGSSAEEAGDLEALIAEAGAESTAIILTQGSYAITESLALGVRGPLSLIGACENNTGVTLELAAPMTAGAGSSVQIYGLGVRGPLSAEEGVNASAIALDGVSSFSLMQSTVTAAAGHGVTSTATGSDGVLISGVTFNAVRNTALSATDALGSWTISGNVSKGPIGEHGVAFNGGDASVNLSLNRFEEISADAMRASSALGSWTISGNVSKGPIGGDGINMAGGHADATVTISTNEFEQIDGNGISAQDALGSWTISGNVSRGPIGGHAMHFHNQGGMVAMTNNTVTGSARGILVNGGSANWTITGNTIGGNEQGQGPQGGFEFFGLSAEGSLNCTGNTLDHVGGLAISFMDSKAAANVANNTMSNSWSDQGGQLLSTRGIGLVVVDSSGLTIDRNTVENNAYAGIVIDLKWWDNDENGSAQVSVRNNTVRGHGPGNSRNIRRQFIPAGSQVTVEDNIVPPNTGPPGGPGGSSPVGIDRGDEPAPPRCGDGTNDPGEDCDFNDPMAAISCKEDCTESQGARAVSASERSLCVAHYEGDIRCIGEPGAQFGEGWNDGNRNDFSAIGSSEVERTGGLIQVAMGLSHGCGITPNGRVWCWGSNTERQAPAGDLPMPPTQVDFAGMNDAAYASNPFVSVHAAATHSCARQQQGQVWCWGLNADGALGLGATGVGTPTDPERLQNPNTNTDLITEAFWTGARNSCAMLNQAYFCWGHGTNLGSQTYTQRSQINLSEHVRHPSHAGAPLRPGGELVIGRKHVCALDVDRRAWCWGDGAHHRLGSGVVDSHDRARAVGFAMQSRTFTTLAVVKTSNLAYGTVTCGVTGDGELWCWGHNTMGLLGASSQNIAAERVDIPNLGRVRELALSRTKTCAIRTDDSVICWGTDRYVETRPEANQPLLPVELANSLQGNRPAFDHVELGARFGLATEALNNGQRRAYIWGRPPGNSPPDPRLRVTPIDEATVAENDADAWAVANDAICYQKRGQIHCTGTLGQRTFGGQNWYTTPALSGQAQLRCGSDHCCSFQPGGTQVKCWGKSTFGESFVHDNFVDVSDNSVTGPITDLALGLNTSCALTDQGVECWGDNSLGQYGNNTQVNSPGPISDPIPTIPIAGPRGHTFDRLEAAHETGTCGLKSSGELWCWGSLDQVFDTITPELLVTDNAGEPYRLLAAADGNVCMVYGPDDGHRIGCLGHNVWGLVSPELGANQGDAFGFTPTHTDVGNVTSLDVHSGTGCLVAGQPPQISCWGKSADFRTATSQPAEFFPQQ